MLVNLVMNVSDIVLSEECLSQNLVWTQLPEYPKPFGVLLSFMNKLQDASLKKLSFDKVVKRQKTEF